MFEVGEKVVCVDGEFSEMVKKLYTDLPKQDQVYVVRDIVAGKQEDMSRTVAVLIVGITGYINSHGLESGFSTHRFRRLDEIKEINKAKRAKKKSKAKKKQKTVEI